MLRMNYKWDPWRDHEWLSVDGDGHVIFFTCVEPSLLPVKISVPWQCLHGLRYVLYALANDCSYKAAKKESPSFMQISQSLSEFGLYVCDGAMLGGTPTFDVVCSPKNPIGLCLLPTPLKVLAKSFSLKGSILRPVGRLVPWVFTNENENTLLPLHIESSTSSLMDNEVKTVEEVLSGGKDTACVFQEDRSRIVGLPDSIGNTFTDCREAKDWYVNLIAFLCSRIGANRLVLSDFYGGNVVVSSFFEFEKQSLDLRIPYRNVTIEKIDERKIDVITSYDDMRGGPAYLPLGHLENVDNDVYFEDWSCKVVMYEQKSVGWRRILGRRFGRGIFNISLL